MSSKSESKPIRYQNRALYKVVDTDVPANNMDDYQTSSTVLTNTESNSGGDRPTWRDDVAKGRSAGNNVTAQRTFHARSPFSGQSLMIRRKTTPRGWEEYRREQSDYYSYYYHSLADPGAASHISEASAEAVRAFVRKARSMMSPLELGIVFGELNETLGLIRHPGRALVGRIGSYLTKVKKDLRRNKHASKSKRNEIVGNTWLEYSFGWAPLLKDAEGLGEAAGLIAAGLPGRGVHKKVGRESETPYTMGYVTLTKIGTISFERVRRMETQVTMYGQIKDDVGQPGQWPRALGLTGDQILPTIWELVPWSFAIDYFTGVGDFISSMCFPKSSMLYYMRSRHTKSVALTRAAYRTAKPDIKSNALTVTSSMSAGSSSITRELFSRDVPADLISEVSFRLPASKWAYVNLGALAKLRLGV